jgi:hypothetical protein
LLPSGKLQSVLSLTDVKPMSTSHGVVLAWILIPNIILLLLFVIIKLQKTKPKTTMQK